MSGDAIGALATSVALLALLTWGMWPTHDRRLFRWSARFGVVISRAGREQVIRDLERSKRLRWGAAVLGLGISALPTYVNLVSPNDAGRFAGEGYGLVWVAAPALGAMVAELVIHQHPRERRAILAPRRWSDFVPTRPVTLSIAAAGTGIVGGAFALIRHTEHAGTAVGAAGGGLFGIGLLILGLRHIVNRPRVALTGEARELDDALRADGAHHLVGAVLALTVSAGSVALSEGTWELFPLITLPLLVVQILALRRWWSLSIFSPWDVTSTGEGVTPSPAHR